MHDNNEAKHERAGRSRTRLVIAVLLALMAGLVLPAPSATASGHSGKGGGHMILSHGVSPTTKDDEAPGNPDVERIPDYFCTETITPTLTSEVASLGTYVGEYVVGGTTYRGLMKYNVMFQNFWENPAGTFGTDGTNPAVTGCGGSYNPLSAGWAFPPTGLVTGAGAPAGLTGTTNKMQIFAPGGSTAILTCNYSTGTYRRNGPVVRITLSGSCGTQPVTETHVGVGYFGRPHSSGSPVADATAGIDCVNYVRQPPGSPGSCTWSALPIPARDLRFVDSFTT